MLLEKIDRFSKRDKIGLMVILTLGSTGLIVALSWHTTHSFDLKVKNGTDLNGTAAEMNGYKRPNFRDINEIDRRLFFELLFL